MKTSNKILLSSALALAVAGIGNADAADEAKPTKEKCYGVVKAEKNDCGAGDAHSCAGQATEDRHPQEWLYLPAGVCDKLAGGSLTAGEAEANDGAAESAEAEEVAE